MPAARSCENAENAPLSANVIQGFQGKWKLPISRKRAVCEDAAAAPVPAKRQRIAEAPGAAAAVIGGAARRSGALVIAGGRRVGALSMAGPVRLAKLLGASARGAAGARRLVGRMMQVPSFRRPSFKRPSIKLPSFKRPSIQLPSFKRPSIKLPSFKQPSFKRPSIKLPSFKWPTWRSTLGCKPKAAADEAAPKAAAEATACSDVADAVQAKPTDTSMQEAEALAQALVQATEAPAAVEDAWAEFQSSLAEMDLSDTESSAEL